MAYTTFKRGLVDLNTCHIPRVNILGTLESKGNKWTGDSDCKVQKESENMKGKKDTKAIRPHAFHIQYSSPKAQNLNWPVGNANQQT